MVTALLAGALLAACNSSSDSGRVASEIRLLNLSADHAPLNLYASWRDGPDSLKAEAVAFESVSAYAALDDDTYNYVLRFRRTDASGTLLTLDSEFLESRTRYTYVAMGASGAFAVRKIDDSVESPEQGLTRVQVMNASSAGSVDVHLTAAGEQLDGDTPAFGGVSSGGAQSGYLDLDSGLYSVRVSGSGDADDLRLQLPELTLADGEVVTLVLTDTRSGVLLDALLLPQGGAPEVLRNDLARVRAAHGSSAGTALTARANGLTLFANATPGIVSQYVNVPAVAPALELLVNGQPVAFDAPALAAGADYTLVTWLEDGETRVLLLEDSNRAPSTTGRAKLRLVHVAHGVDAPINLSIDFFPVLEGVEPGAASAYAEVDSGTDAQLDVFDSFTAENLWRRESATISGARVYTLFVTGNDPGAVGGTLRRDR